MNFFVNKIIRVMFYLMLFIINIPIMYQLYIQERNKNLLYIDKALFLAYTTILIILYFEIIKNLVYTVYRYIKVNDRARYIFIINIAYIPLSMMTNQFRNQKLSKSM